MKTKVIIVAVALVSLLLAVTAVEATTVRVEPAPQIVKSGDAFSVAIVVDEVTDMAGHGGILHFDPAAMQATAVTSGVITGFPQNYIDNIAGTVTFGNAKAGAGVSGLDLTLTTIDFDTIAPAECWFDLNLTDVQLYDSAVQPIPAGVINGEVGLDNTPPEVEITAPANNTWFDNESVSIKFHPSDNKATTVSYTIYDNGVQAANGTAPVCSNTTVDLGVLSNCNHNITVVVTDTVGLSGSDEIMIHVDLIPPTVVILSPVTCTWFDSEDVVVTFHASDNKATVLNFIIRDNGAETASDTLDNNTTKEVNLGVLTSGDHVITVNVTDSVGKNGSAQVTIHVDLTPPTITILSPTERIYASLCVKLNFTAYDPDSVINWTAYSLDGGANVTSGNTTLLGLAEGNHTIIVYARNQVGKLNSSGPVNFKLHPADINFDGRVYVADNLLFAQAYNSRPADPNWNPDADFNCDDHVYVADNLILAQNYNKYY